MPWIPDVNPNELVESAWGNTIRDHTVHAFANAADRAAAIPAPNVGMLSHLGDYGALEVYYRGTWQPISSILNVSGVVQAARSRTGTLAATTDANGVFAQTFTPVLASVLSIIGTPSDQQLPYFLQPVRGQFAPGSGVAQWRALNTTGAGHGNQTIRFDYWITETF